MAFPFINIEIVVGSIQQLSRFEMCNLSQILKLFKFEAKNSVKSDTNQSSKSHCYELFMLQYFVGIYYSIIDWEF